MNKRFGIPVWLFLFFLTFLRAESKKPLEGILNRSVPVQHTWQVKSRTSAVPVIDNTVVSKFKIKVRFMNGDCTYAIASVPYAGQPLLLCQAIKCGYTAPVLNDVAGHIRSLRGPPVLSVC